jgi:hypothetical protein
MQSGKFTDQQKQDYAYLRSKFDKADMGSFKQYAELIKDATLDIVTDPTAIAAALTYSFNWWNIISCKTRYNYSSFTRL